MRKRRKTMSKAQKRTKAEKIAHLERSIRKFGDSDGKRSDALARLTGKKATASFPSWGLALARKDKEKE
jgi:hypothetical protein